MSGEYLMCVSCGNVKEDDNICKCPKCDHMFCNACCNWSYGFPDCPKCGNHSALFSRFEIGKITRKGI